MTADCLGRARHDTSDGGQRDGGRDKTRGGGGHQTTWTGRSSSRLWRRRTTKRAKQQRKQRKRRARQLQRAGRTHQNRELDGRASNDELEDAKEKEKAVVWESGVGMPESDHACFFFGPFPQSSCLQWALLRLWDGVFCLCRNTRRMAINEKLAAPLSSLELSSRSLEGGGGQDQSSKKMAQRHNKAEKGERTSGNAYRQGGVSGRSGGGCKAKKLARLP